jgi:hypothetical protein
MKQLDSSRSSNNNNRQHQEEDYLTPLCSIQISYRLGYQYLVEASVMIEQVFDQYCAVSKLSSFIRIPKSNSDVKNDEDLSKRYGILTLIGLSSDCESFKIDLLLSWSGRIIFLWDTLLLSSCME